MTMALQLRPNCQYCDKDLPPTSTEARICSYECTFCTDCAENKLGNVCPNCGGGFVPRPIRPAKEWRPGLSVASHLQTRRYSAAFGADQKYTARRAMSASDKDSSCPGWTWASIIRKK